jgi:hypothetical protein
MVRTLAGSGSKFIGFRYFELLPAEIPHLRNALTAAAAHRGILLTRNE